MSEVNHGARGWQPDSKPGGQEGDGLEPVRERWSPQNLVLQDSAWEVRLRARRIPTPRPEFYQQILAAVPQYASPPVRKQWRWLAMLFLCCTVILARVLLYSPQAVSSSRPPLRLLVLQLHDLQKFFRSQKDWLLVLPQHLISTAAPSPPVDFSTDFIGVLTRGWDQDMHHLRLQGRRVLQKLPWSCN